MIDYEKTIAYGFATYGYRQGTKECVAFHKGIEYACREYSPAWITTSVQKPRPGSRIVKRWKGGSMWAGLYDGTEKEGSFDYWCYLPE